MRLGVGAKGVGMWDAERAGGGEGLVCAWQEA